MFKSIINKILAGLVAVFGVLFLYQKHKTNTAVDETEKAKTELDTMRTEVKVEKAVQESKTAIIEGKSASASIDKKKAIDEILKKQEKEVNDKIGEKKDGEEFTFNS
jgi:dsDNA-specific endonuclease/ATPase MutS2